MHENVFFSHALVQGDIKDGLGNLPELQEQVDGIPGEEYIE